jgi:hypothetical protein
VEKGLFFAGLRGSGKFSAAELLGSLARRVRRGLRDQVEVMGGRETNYKERKPASQADSEMVALRLGVQAKLGRTELPRDRIETTSFRDVRGRTFLLLPTP